MNFDDPRITAHALGELDSAEDIAAVERLLRESPEARAEYDEMKSFMDHLRRDLKGESAEGLSDRQRSEVLATARVSPVLNGNVIQLAPTAAKRKASWYRQSWVPVGIAAVALFATVIVSLWDSEQTHERYVREAQRTQVHERAPLSVIQQSAPPAGSEDGVEQRFGDDAGVAGVDILTTESAAAAPKRESEMFTRGRHDAMDRTELSLAQEPARPAPVELTRSSQAAGEMLKEAAPADAQGLGIAPAPRGPASMSASSKVDRFVVPPEDSMTDSSAVIKLKETPTTAPASPSPENVPQRESVGRASGTRTTGLAPAKPASAALGGAVSLADSENEFLGKDYSMRNFRQEAEEGRGYAFAVPNTLPGLQPSVPPQEAEAFYTQLTPGRTVTEHNTEAYDSIQDNPFLTVKDNPLSTFSIDVDTASYANVRRLLTGGELPPKGAVRIEELVNYFSYDYPQPQGADPFSTTLEVATCPWEPKHRLIRVGLKGRELPKEQRPPSNLVFLIDVSGSMQPQNKLPLVKESLQQMLAELGPKDTVAIAVYSGASGTVLEPTNDRDAIRAALSRLEAGGSTNGASGIQLAYDLAKKAFNKEGNNRVILATDGDFNVGVTNRSELVEIIEKRAKEGVFLTVLGFGMGNLKDATLEQLADKGNGNYAYIDSIREGRKVLVEQMAGTLFTIAKDVKIQVEFNPAQVAAYRLIGYENRLLAKEDFNNDKKDAGEIGAGHTVTALYQVVPAGVAIESPGVDPLKYQTKPETVPAPAAAPEGASKEMLTLKLRFKQPDGDTSTLREFPLTDQGLTWERSSRDFRFAAAVASFGMLLRDSPHKGSSNWDSTMELAVEGKGEDAGGYRQEFIGLVEKAKALPARGNAK